MMNDPLEGYEPQEDDHYNYRLKWIMFFLLLGIFLSVVALTLTSGCVTLTKQIIMPTPEPTPKPTPTATPAPPPTPTPEPTPDWSYCKLSDMCYQMRDYHFWFRPNANNFGESLRTFVTIYGYRMYSQYHWHSVSWGSRAFFLQKPDAGMKYLFVFINIYSDTETKATQYGYGPEHFVVQVKDKLYYMDEGHNPAVWIKELQDDANAYDYAHVQGVIPYGYKIKQDLRTGIITAEPLNVIYPGRSNAWDGYLIYQIPEDATPDQIKIVTSFDNLGGRAMWQLK